VRVYSIFPVDGHPKAIVQWRFHWGKTPINLNLPDYTYGEML